MMRIAWVLLPLLAASPVLAEPRVVPPDAYRNPVIRGDWSDPGLIRVGDDYYSLRSTFGWKPGLAIMHSRDLVHWRYAGYALTEHPDMRDGTSEGGIRGSEIGYNPNDKHFLVYAPMRESNRIIVYRASSVEGPWQGPHIVSEGYDPGFFADDDGRLYLTQTGGMIWELTPDGLQKKKPVGQVKPGGEGPAIVKRNGFYYYVSSHGGTLPGQKHDVQTLRSRRLEGPWEPDPNNPQMFAPVESNATFQGPGHAALIQTQKGEWFVMYHAFELSHYSLGRQTLLSPVEWTADGWWRPVEGRIPALVHRRPDLPETKFQVAQSDEFDEPRLGLQWFFNQGPLVGVTHQWLDARKGWLRVRTLPGDIASVTSRRNVLLQRVIDKKFAFTTRLSFRPNEDGHAAGLHLYHDPGRNVWLACARRQGRVGLEVGRYNVDKGPRPEILTRVTRPCGPNLHLKIAVDGEETATFHVSDDGRRWTALPVSVYFGNSERFLRDGKKGDPDLGWAGRRIPGRSLNRWTATTMGLFATGGDARRSIHVDFDHFRVTSSDDQSVFSEAATGAPKRDR